MPALDTAWENTKYTPVNNVPWQQINILFGEPENISYGECHTEIGYMQITLYYPPLKGARAINERAELIRQTFRRGQSFIKDGQAVTIQRTPEIMGGQPEKDYFTKIMKIRFFSN